MQINLQDLASKKAKSAEGLMISDHTLDMAKFTGSELIFSGNGVRGLVIKNPKGLVKFQDCTIDNASTGVTVKFDGVYNGIKVDGSGTTKLFGKAGNSASQMIYFNGTWSNVEVCGFEIDQRRNDATGSTTTGSALQFAGVLNTSHNLGTVQLHDIVIRNAGDEGNYDNHFERGAGYARGNFLIVERVKVFGSGRDFFQQWGFINAVYRDCYGENGGKEANPDHCSALSMNGWTQNLIVENCEFKNVAQLLYSGVPAPGETIKAELRNVRYTQGTHAGKLNNQAMYLKGPGKYVLSDCLIDAPNAVIAAITADNCQVEYTGCQINAKDVDRLFNSGKVTEIAKVIETTCDAVVKVTTMSGVSTTQYFIGTQEFIIKP
jgi:hypothetical protein